LLDGKAIRSPLRDGKVDRTIVEENSTIVRELMHRLCPAVLANAEALSTNVVFFAASSFGHTPLKIGPGEYVPDPAKLKPDQVEVPILWILSQISPHLISTHNAIGRQVSPAT
jgi:hypothetical protein